MIVIISFFFSLSFALCHDCSFCGSYICEDGPVLGLGRADINIYVSKRESREMKYIDYYFFHVAFYVKFSK